MQNKIAVADSQKFHVSLKAFIRRDDGRILIVRENPENGHGDRWELPGGRIKKDEDKTPLMEVLRRELGEEIGKVIVIFGGLASIWRRPRENNDIQALLVGIKAKYVKGDVELGPEHTEYRWVYQEDLHCIDFVSGYKAAIEHYFQQEG